MKTRSKRHEVAGARHGEQYLLYATIEEASSATMKAMAKVRQAYEFPYRTRVDHATYIRLCRRKTGLPVEARPRRIAKMSRSQMHAAFGPLSAW